MNRSIEQALANLIPRHNGALPPELIELASSLLAQSRNKASNLKAEEEIGRTYACANIACERLKTTLDLPKIEPRPPCPPRVYKNLYTYLDSTLVSTRKRTRESQSQPRLLLKAKPTIATPSKSTPQSKTTTPQSSKAKPIPSRTPGSIRPGAQQSIEGFSRNRTPRKGLQFQSNKEKDERVPPWVLPAIRFLCKELGVPNAIPHVLAGVESILTLPCPGPEDEEDEEPAVKKLKKDARGDEEGKGKMEGKLPALMAAVFFFVRTRLLGKETTGKEYDGERKAALEVLRKVRGDEVVLEKVGGRDGENGDVAWREWEDVGSKDVDAWVLEISRNGWIGLDWFLNIVEGGGVPSSSGGREVDEDEFDDEVENGDGESKEVMRRGLGTMMQDKVDYLSETKRREYAVWKTAIVAKMEELDELVASGAAALNNPEEGTAEA